MLRLRSCASSRISVSYWRELRVALRFGEQDAVGHQLDVARRARAVGEADLEADRLAELALQLVRDPRGGRARGDAPRLGVADQPFHAAAELEADLGELGGLAGAGLAADDDDLVGADRARDVLALRADRQVGRELRPRQVGAPRRELFPGVALQDAAGRREAPAVNRPSRRSP